MSCAVNKSLDEQAHKADISTNFIFNKKISAANININSVSALKNCF
jgi:hypothetical protein